MRPRRIADLVSCGIEPAPLRVHVLLIAGQVCFASLAVAGKLAIGHIPPAGIVLVRMLGGAIVFGALAWRRGTFTFVRSDLPFLFLCAILGVAANQELFIHGLARSTAINASVLGTTIPVFTALTAIALRREPVHVRRLVGIAIAFGGAIALVGIDQVSTSSEHVAGSVMVLVNSACYGVYLVIVRPLASRTDPIALLAALFWIGVPMVAPLGIYAFASMPGLTWADVGFLAFLVAVPTVGAYILIQMALARAEATLVAAYIYLQPVVALTGAVILLDEQLTARLAVCAPIVFAGVWLAARRV